VAIHDAADPRAVALLDVDRDGDEQIAWDEFLGWWKSMKG